MGSHLGSTMYLGFPMNPTETTNYRTFIVYTRRLAMPGAWDGLMTIAITLMDTYAKASVSTKPWRGDSRSTMNGAGGTLLKSTWIGGSTRDSFEKNQKNNNNNNTEKEKTLKMREYR